MATTQSMIKERLNKKITSFLHKPRIKKFHSKSNERVSYDDFLTDKLLIISAIRSGIPYSLFHLIQEYTPFSDNEWADFLDLPAKSLHSHKTSGEHYFNAIHSQKIIEIAEVTKVGREVFGNMDKLKLWLNTPNFALGKLKPLELLKDSYGKELVISELIRINYGILV